MVVSYVRVGLGLDIGGAIGSLVASVGNRCDSKGSKIAVEHADGFGVRAEESMQVSIERATGTRLKDSRDEPRVMRFTNGTANGSVDAEGVCGRGWCCVSWLVGTCLGGAEVSLAMSITSALVWSGGEGATTKWLESDGCADISGG